jgi:hypothetical protein
MFANVTRVPILGAYVFCERNSGKELELSKSEAWLIKERVYIEYIYIE